MPKITLTIPVEDGSSYRTVANAVRRAFSEDKPLAVGESGEVKGVSYKVATAPVGRKGDLAEVRAWLASQGITEGYGSRGRIRADLLAMYAEAHKG